MLGAVRSQNSHSPASIPSCSKRVLRDRLEYEASRGKKLFACFFLAVSKMRDSIDKWGRLGLITALKKQQCQEAFFAFLRSKQGFISKLVLTSFAIGSAFFLWRQQASFLPVVPLAPNKAVLYASPVCSKNEDPRFDRIRNGCMLYQGAIKEQEQLRQLYAKEEALDVLEEEVVLQAWNWFVDLLYPQNEKKPNDIVQGGLSHAISEKQVSRLISFLPKVGARDLFIQDSLSPSYACELWKPMRSFSKKKQAPSIGQMRPFLPQVAYFRGPIPQPRGSLSYACELIKGRSF